MKFSFIRHFVIPLVLLLAASCLLLTTLPARADETQDKLSEINKQIQEYEQKLKDLSGQKKTLADTIVYLNIQISLTQSNIAKTEETIRILSGEIEDLTKKIGNLNRSLDALSNVLIDRIRTSYMAGQFEPLSVFFSTSGLQEFASQVEYFRAAQKNDRGLLIAMETTRTSYDAQKQALELKHQEQKTLNTTLKRQQQNLASQQQEKQRLLEATKNDEKRFQELLAKAQAELVAIQNIIAGKGQETKVGDVSEGATIASIISGSSACSSGSHLHFQVAQNSELRNPFDYLSSKSIEWDNADPQPSFNGSWNWPINDPIKITQGYGHTSYSAIYANGFHTGVDMVSTQSNDVKAVKNGVLYRGAIACGGGTLRYVRVDQGDNLSTYYLHVNYI